jgi:hypothetical protein
MFAGNKIEAASHVTGNRTLATGNWQLGTNTLQLPTINHAFHQKH